jgi:hypothetical protein
MKSILGVRRGLGRPMHQMSTYQVDTPHREIRAVSPELYRSKKSRPLRQQPRLSISSQSQELEHHEGYSHTRHAASVRAFPLHQLPSGFYPANGISNHALPSLRGWAQPLPGNGSLPPGAWGLVMRARISQDQARMLEFVSLTRLSG